MSSPHHGRHEYGQNFLCDRRVVADIVKIVSHTTGPIIEIGAGDGALTLPLQRLNRPLTAIEIDRRRADRLAARTSAEVVSTDFLRYRLPQTPHVVVGNLPFHLTTAILRRLLHGPGWTDAVLLMQWEVARRRAAVGGATMMTAQWWPWFEFGLARKVSAEAFRPRPSVDAGLLTIARRGEPLIPWTERRRCQALAHEVFTGPGRGVGQILRRHVNRQWLRANGIHPSALPRDLTAQQWAALFAATGQSAAEMDRTPRGSDIRRQAQRIQSVDRMEQTDQGQRGEHRRESARSHQQSERRPRPGRS